MKTVTEPKEDGKVAWYFRPLIFPTILSIVFAVGTTAFSWGVYYNTIKSDIRLMQKDQTYIKQGIADIKQALKEHQTETVTAEKEEGTWRDRVVVLETEVEQLLARYKLP